MENNRKMKDIPANDRPYERCVQLGTEVLSDEELLSIIIRTGSSNQNSLETARQVLALNYPRDGILGLCHFTLEELKSVEGIGTVKGIQLMCIGELSRRIAKRSATVQISRYDSPEAVVHYYMEDLRHAEQELVYAMFLDSKNCLIKDALIFKGTVNASMASPREIFVEAMRNRAVGIILVHNHPSGDPTPSQEDYLLTNRIRQGAKLLGVRFLDHIIIGDNTYFSYRKEGILTDGIKV